MRGKTLAFLFVLLVAGCSRHTPPPQGLWEGTYETAEAMVAARIEIDAKGNIRVSAPNAEDVGDNEDDRAAMRQKLAGGLSAGWNEVEPRTMEFDGRTFRKPGGIAPQMVWYASRKQMILVVYPGKKSAIRIPMRPVEAFSDDPWAE